MAGSTLPAQSTDDLKDSELRAFQDELTALAETARDFPLEYVLGSYEMLFESRDDIQIIVDNLSESLERGLPVAA